MTVNLLEALPEGARRALHRARENPISYAVRMVRAPDGRLVAILGEAHVKLAKAAEIGLDVVSNFELRGVETFQRKQVFLGRALGVLITGPRAVLRLLTFGTVKGSTITDAKQLPSGYTVELERAKRMPFGLHVASAYMTGFFSVAFLTLALPALDVVTPRFAGLVRVASVAFNVHMFAVVPAAVLRRHSWSWVVHPFLGILTPRDELMAAGTVRMLEDHPGIDAAVVVMGRAHVQGYERLLVERYGFSRIEAW